MSKVTKSVSKKRAGILRKKSTVVNTLCNMHKKTRFRTEQQDSVARKETAVVTTLR